ncbi:protein kinase domain-containing protein [Yoonia sp. 2307UL14-13]|uniref:protein kinase domain-containing protein n=1 Tax=Yoonia sp. 2307UL14-13 TaxID=3126506 RepID=UPI00309EA030
MGKPQVQDNGEDKDAFVDELKPGTSLMHGQYTIERFLNAGGFGITYLAKDSLDRKVVIKECFPGAFCRRSRYIVQARSRAHQNELKSIVRLFVQEARSLAKLDHPNIVGVHQVFEDNETAYMALDFVEGRDLLDTIEDPNHGLTPPQIKKILKEVLGAVGFIHDQGILHRDISPDNILINSQLHPVLIDFGAAREEATKQSRVLSALRVVKDGYSPQEFYIAGSEQSPSSDLYALAASFHHLIAKDVPPNSQARLAAIASGEPDPYVPLIGRFDEYDDDFLAAVDKALAVLPKDRVQSAQDWINMMDGIEGNVTPLNVVNAGASATEEGGAAGQSGGKSKMPLLLGSAAVVALLIGAGGFVMLGGEDVPVASTETPAASTQTTTASVAPTVAEPVATPEPAPADETIAAAEEPATVAPAPVVVEEPSVADTSTDAPSAAETPRPVIVDEPAEPTQTTSGPVVVTGPVASEEQAIPDIRPSARPEDLSVAAAPVIEEPPLPEPVETPRPTAVEPEANAALPNQPSVQLTADAATPQVTLPDVPAEVAAVGTGPAVEEIAAVVPGNELQPSIVETNWSVELPFAADRDGSNVIGQVGFISPVWVKPGLAITSVNGTPVDAINDIPAALRQNPSLGEADQIEVEFGTIDLTNGAEADYNWTLPVVQETELLNGLRFESVFTGTEWRTSVAEVPASLTGDLQVGDVLKGFISGEDVIDGRNTVAEIVERELAEGNQLFIFDVLRGDDRWVAMFNYAGG